MSEPKLTGLCMVGNTRFAPGVKLSTAQGAIDRLFTRQQKLEGVMLEVKEFAHRLPPSLAEKIEAALSLGAQ